MPSGASSAAAEAPGRMLEQVDRLTVTIEAESGRPHPVMIARPSPPPLSTRGPAGAGVAALLDGEPDVLNVVPDEFPHHPSRRPRKPPSMGATGMSGIWPRPLEAIKLDPGEAAAP